MTAPTEHTVTVAARRVAFLRHGRGAPLVLLHGAGGNHHAYDALLPHLTGWEVFVPAYPGRLGSEGPPLDTAAALADWVLAFADAVGLGEVSLVGHSLGGGVALEAALHPAGAGRVKALFLVSTGARLRVHPALLELARQAVEQDTPLPMVDTAFGDGAPRAVREAVGEVWSRTAPVAAEADWRAANAFDRMADLASVAAPARVLVGASDQLTPEKYARFLADGLPAGVLRVHPSAGHMLPWEAPEWVAREIADGAP